MKSKLRAPVLFVPHGGGPLPLLNDIGHKSLIEYMQSLRQEIQQPKAVVVITAHWEETQPSITAQQYPSLLFDYYGFPPESYEIDYPASGDPELAQGIARLLSDAGFKPHLETERGYDHGTFVPLKLIIPDASIPVIQLSLISGLDPVTHIRFGQALAPLREQGIVILGSGMSFHNMRAFFSPNPDTLQKSNLFNQWLVNSLTSTDLSFQEKEKLLSNWTAAPQARFCHPREEHLLPLLVCFGAAIDTPVAQTNFTGLLFNTWISAFIWR